MTSVSARCFSPTTRSIWRGGSQGRAQTFRYNRFARLAHEIVASTFAEDPPQFFQVPFGHFALDPIKEALMESGFTDVRIAVSSRVKEVATLEDFARGLVFGNPVIDEIRRRGATAPEALAKAVEEAMEGEFGAKPSRLPMQAIFVEARRR